jgi:hypothetical protein
MYSPSSTKGILNLPSSAMWATRYADLSSAKLNLHRRFFQLVTVVLCGDGSSEHPETRRWNLNFHSRTDLFRKSSITLHPYAARRSR